MEPKQKLENAFKRKEFITKLINLTDRVLNNSAMMEHVNKLTSNPALKDDFADIKAYIAKYGIDPRPRAEIPEPLPRLEPAAGLEIKPANASDELKAGRVMMTAVQGEYAKADEETKKKRTALERAQKEVENAEAAGAAAVGVAAVAEMTAARLAEARARAVALEQELSAAVQYEQKLAEIRTTLQTAVAKVEKAEIAAEAAGAAGAADGVLTDEEMAEVRKQLAEATTNARTELEKLKPARGGRNRRTKKTNYYRKRRRTTHNRSRRNLN